jgi:protein-L-isoaspartate(D-aspartate) O-methyltransferase
MSGTGKRFPLSLSSIADKPAGSRQTTRTATPQTATRNAAHTLAIQLAGKAAKPVSNAVAGKPAQNGAGKPPMNSAPGMQPARNMPAQQQTERAMPMVSEGVRRAMVARVARQGVKDPKVLTAMETVPRHLFLEPAMASQAYIDASLPIGHHQTISQPYIVARMIEVMRDNAQGGVLNKVLEIGTGCGYQAAVLSLVAKEVYSVERIKPLHELAKANLRPMRIANIRLHYGDGMLGFPQVAPFDGIILAAAGLEVPQALLEQMSIGGRLVAPVGAHHQVLQVIERINKYEWTTVTLEDCHFVPLRPGTAG